MNILKQYLDSLFSELPNNEKARKVKEDLLNMMEDKYQSLIEEGNSKNEAIGKVISEFGNIDEIKELVNNYEIEIIEEKKEYGSDTKKDLLKEISKSIASSILLAFGVGFCIFSIAMVILMNALSEIVKSNSDLFGLLGVCLMFLFVAIGVVLIVISNMVNKRKKVLSLDSQSNEVYNESKKKIKLLKDTMVVISVFLYIISIIPVIIVDEVIPGDLFDAIGTCVMFTLVAIGVGLCVCGCRFNTLYLNITNEVNEAKKEKTKTKYKNPKMETIMECFWPTVVCLYFIISAISWYYLNYTWVIFPIGYLVKKLIDLNCKEEQ